MAEAVVKVLVKKLAQWLDKEVKLLEGVRKEVEAIKKALESIQAFLKDADARAEAGGDSNHGVKVWVKQLREESYRIEDVTDEYMLLVAQAPDDSVYKAAYFFKTLKRRHKIAKEIQDIRSSVLEINQRGKDFKFFKEHKSSSGKRNAPHDPRGHSHFIKEAEIVGIDTIRHKLIGWLEEKKRKRVVISLVGMGGLGKTTIAKNVYDNQSAKDHFDCHAWVNVGKVYSKTDLLRTLMKQFDGVTKKSTLAKIYKMKERELIAELRAYLKKKRYLVVFDDVWEENFWADIEDALLDNEKDSRIMLTTRKKNVALYCKKSSAICVHELKQLSKKNSWRLFCRKAFNGVCPSSLKKLSTEIVDKCGGLPLAIVLVGGLLQMKSQDVSEWRKLHKSLYAKFGSDPHLKSFDRVLLESYHDLPHHLKSCFLYFSLFPNGYSIRCVRIIKLWIAEGFVKEETSLTLEELAGEYLNELIHRSLVQVSKVDIGGRPRSCRVHDLMHNIICGKTKELGFHQVLDKRHSSFDGKPRRLSIHESTDYVQKMDSKGPMVRSLFLFNVDKVPSNSFMSTFYANFKLLTVLDFGGAPLDSLPEAVGKFLCLTYLSIRDTKIRELPKSIGGLRFLETLDLKRSLVDELPIEINNLKNLQFLLAYSRSDKNSSFDSRQGVKIPEGFGHLKTLQKLHFVNVDNGVHQIKELENLTNLRKLGIKKLTGENGKHLYASIRKMKDLESLEVSSIDKKEILDLGSKTSPPQYLERLYLKGRLVKLPDWISKLKNLIIVRLMWSGLTDDALSVLRDLPKLLELQLFHNAYDGKQLHFEKEGFQKLKILDLYKLGGLKNMRIDKGALPALEELLIGRCSSLKVPTGIEHLRKLKRLVFSDVTLEFLQDAQYRSEKMKHIPTVLLKIKDAVEPFRTISLHNSLPEGKSVDKFEAEDNLILILVFGCFAYFFLRFCNVL